MHCPKHTHTYHNALTNERHTSPRRPLWMWQAPDCSLFEVKSHVVELQLFGYYISARNARGTRCTAEISCRLAGRDDD